VARAVPHHQFPVEHFKVSTENTRIREQKHFAGLVSKHIAVVCRHIGLLIRLRQFYSPTHRKMNHDLPATFMFLVRINHYFLRKQKFQNSTMV
jgi:hypothetical protein